MNNYSQYSNYYYPRADERFAGGIIAPLLLGGVAGYAIGNNNNYNNNWRPMVFYPTYRPYPIYNPYYYPPFYRK